MNHDRPTYYFHPEGPMHRIHEDAKRRNEAEAMAWDKVRQLEKEIEEMKNDRPMYYPDQTVQKNDVVDRLRCFCDPKHVQDPSAREAMADAWVEIERLRKAAASPPILPKLVAWPEGHVAGNDVTRAAFLEALDKGEKQ